jgi:hypothetical protein
MAVLKEYLPHIRKLIAINVFLIAYFLSPSFIFFVTLSLAMTLIIVKNCDVCKSLLNCSGECNCVLNINHFYQMYGKLPFNQRTLLANIELIVLVVFKFAFDLLWHVPSWLIILLSA